MPEEWLIERIQQVGATPRKLLSLSFSGFSFTFGAVFRKLRYVFVTVSRSRCGGNIPCCYAVIYKHCITRVGKDVFDDWLSDLADARTQTKIATRTDRLAAGKFGDFKPLRQGLCELRIDWGPGYRVYAMLGRASVLLLCGGDKQRQSSDIERALGYFNDYKERTGGR